MQNRQALEAMQQTLAQVSQLTQVISQGQAQIAQGQAQQDVAAPRDPPGAAEGVVSRPA